MRWREIIAEGKVQRVAVWSGATIPVLHNPTPAQFKAFAAKHRSMRGLLSYNGENLWVWDGSQAVHTNLIQELGLDRVDCVAYTDGRWSGPVNDYEGYKPAVERVTPYQSTRDPEADAALLAQLRDELGEAKAPTIKDVTTKKGINRKKNERVLDPNGYFAKAKAPMSEDKTLSLPDIEVGDEVKVGKFKNRKAEVTGFTTDDHNQPVLKTTKGDQKLFKPRISKLEDQ